MIETRLETNPIFLQFIRHHLRRVVFQSSRLSCRQGRVPFPSIVLSILCVTKWRTHSKFCFQSLSNDWKMAPRLKSVDNFLVLLLTEVIKPASNRTCEWNHVNNPSQIGIGVWWVGQTWRRLSFTNRQSLRRIHLVSVVKSLFGFLCPLRNCVCFDAEYW